MDSISVESFQDVISHLEAYYQEIRDFKSFFIRNCLVDKKYEAYKVWAHWLIRSLCQVNHNYHIIPPPSIAQDDQIITHLIEKGATESEAQCFYQHVISRALAIYNRYHQFKVDLLQNQDMITKVSAFISYSTYKDEDNIYHLYRLQETYTKHNDLKYNKLMDQYKGPPEHLNFYLFEIGFNYYVLDGHSLQWCIPPRVFEVLSQELGARTELFASPTNSTLPMYCSLFYVDRMFGSLDNMFNLEPQQTLEGTYEVNPPFIENVFIRSSQMVIDFLTQSQNADKDLMFIYIMPSWLDSLGYQSLNQSKYLIDEIVFNENRHYYYQASNDRMVKANFESHVLIIGTHLSRVRWTQRIKSEIVKCFCYNDRKNWNSPTNPFKKISQL